MDNTLITQDRLDEIIRLSNLAARPQTYMAEVGVYKGGSLKLICEKNPNNEVLGFDTFEGLPKEQWSDTEIHKPGEFNDTWLTDVIDFVNCENVNLVVGLFPDSAKGFEDKKFSFVHVDTDFYEGVKACIDWFYPRLVEGGIMVFDDFLWPNCPGVKKALDESGLSYNKTNAEYQAYLVK